MKSDINDAEITLPEDRSQLLEAAFKEDDACVSAGGLALRLGLMDSVPLPGPGPAVAAFTFARLIEYWRREQQLTVAKLAAAAGLQEEDVLEAERGHAVPGPRVLHGLSEALGVSYQNLLCLTGQVTQAPARLQQAATRFAASSLPMDRLSDEEREHLHDLMAALSEQA